MKHKVSRRKEIIRIRKQIRFAKKEKRQEHSQRHSMKAPSSRYQNQKKIPPKKKIMDRYSFINILIDAGFPSGSDSKESACNVGDSGSIPGLRRFPGEMKGNLIQYSCLENPMDRGAGWATVTKSQTQLSN